MLFKFIDVWHFYCMMPSWLLFSGCSVVTMTIKLLVLYNSVQSVKHNRDITRPVYTTCCFLCEVISRLRPIPVLSIGIGPIPLVSVRYRYRRYWSRYLTNSPDSRYCFVMKADIVGATDLHLSICTEAAPTRWHQRTPPLVNSNDLPVGPSAL